MLYYRHTQSRNNKRKIYKYVLKTNGKPDEKNNYYLEYFCMHNNWYVICYFFLP